jgi:hypothetical protein
MDITAEQQKAVLDKIQGAGHDAEELEQLTEDEVRVLKSIAGKQQAMTLHASDIEALAGDVIEGFAAKLEHGNLGLVKRSVAKTTGEIHHDVARESREMMDLNRTLAVEA